MKDKATQRKQRMTKFEQVFKSIRQESQQPSTSNSTKRNQNTKINSFMPPLLAQYFKFSGNPFHAPYSYAYAHLTTSLKPHAG